MTVGREGSERRSVAAAISRRPVPPMVGLLLGLAAVSTASTWIRLAQADVPSLALAAWRMTFASLALAPLALATARAEWRDLQIGDWIRLAVSGGALALHFYTWITSLALTSVAASVALVSTNPFFVALLSHFLLGERVRPKMIAGIVVAIIGTIIIGLGHLEAGSSQLLGNLLALLGAFSVAVYMLIGRQQRQRLSLLGYVFPVYAVAAVLLLALSLLASVPLGGYPARSWGWLLLVALIPQVIGHTSYNWALAYLSSIYVSLAVLAEPVGSTILAWLVLHERPGLSTVIGGAIILAGIALATWTRNTGKLVQKDTDL
jgi:drug/metabolite transporter (DMT)-like permease